MDRLSALPDSLLIHILSLSFPDVERASITCVLSKRWQFLWTNFPRLEFLGSRINTDRKRAMFVAWINRALANRRAEYADKFHVTLKYDYSLASDVDAWVEFVVRNKVKEFSLGLNTRNHLYMYMIPQILYSTSSLTNLLLRHCTMAPLRTVKWKSLTKLEMVEAKMNGVEKILSGCPVLHTLNLIDCWGFTRLEINSPSLCKLWVWESAIRKDEALLEISAPYLHSLSITFYANRRRKLVLLNISSLVSASIDLAGKYVQEYDWNSIKELFERSRHVKELELGINCFQVVSRLALSDWQLPRSSRVSLRLTTYRDCNYKTTISGIVSILESSPMLETLVIRGRTYHHYYLEDYRDSGAMGDLDGDLMHLKRVKMVSFVSPTIARALLKRAIILEEMIILEDTHLRKKGLLLGPQLLTYPKSSHKALIRFQFY